MLNIEIENPKREFFEYLKDSENGVIFSAPFGHGKSYFLDKFFEEKGDEFFTIKLNPVNYSLASNEDIFRLLLIDIIKHITNTKEFKDIPSESISTTLLTQQFIVDNIADIAAAGLQLIPKVGGSLSKGLKSFNELFEKFQNYKSAINERWSNEALKEAFKNTYLLFENDTYLEIINEILNVIAKDRKKILVIDDLDRIDPEHIFRIFNVFSAAFDTTNKSGLTINFDSTIFVCDFENIKNIFKHKYGKSVDFGGYFNKFHHENTPFYFSNRNAVANCVSDMMTKIPKSIAKHGNYLTNPQLGPFLTGILQILVVTKSLDLRTLEKFDSSDKLYIPNLDRTFYIKENPRANVMLRDFSIAYPAHILYQLYGSYDALIYNLKTAEDFIKHNAFSTQISHYTPLYLNNIIFPVTQYFQHKFVLNTGFRFTLPGYSINGTGFLKRGSSPSERNFYRIEFENELDLSIINFVGELIKALEILKEWQVFDNW